WDRRVRAQARGRAARPDPGTWMEVIAMNMSERDRRVAVVTGGAGAIGGAIAARLARDHTVVVLDRAGGDVVVDLGAADDVRRAAALVVDRYGGCDVLVHAAAMVAFGPLEDVELDVWRA